MLIGGTGHSGRVSCLISLQLYQPHFDWLDPKLNPKPLHHCIVFLQVISPLIIIFQNFLYFSKYVYSFEVQQMFIFFN